MYDLNQIFILMINWEIKNIFLILSYFYILIVLIKKFLNYK